MRSDLFVQGENKEEKMSFDFVPEEASAPELADASVHPFWKEKKNQEDSPSETEAFDEEEQIMKRRKLLMTFRKKTKPNQRVQTNKFAKNGKFS